MTLTDTEAKTAYLEESFDFYAATKEQVDALCKELGTDQPLMRWDDYQEELQVLLEEARNEFEMGY